MTAFMVDWRARGRIAALLPALVLVIWVGFVQALVYRACTRERDAYSLLSRGLERVDETPLPIVIADARDYLQVNFKAPGPLKSRLVFARGAAVSRAESSSAREIETLGHWVPLAIGNLAELRAAHSRFLVFALADSGLVSSLEKSDSGATVTTRGPELYLVERTRKTVRDRGSRVARIRDCRVAATAPESYK